MRIPLVIPSGLNDDDTSFGAEGRWQFGDKVRFRYGRAEVDGGWESLVDTLLTGVCRNVFSWSDNSAILNIGFGTHSALQVWQGGVLFDITPFGPARLLGSNPLTVSGGSATITVHDVAHGLTTGASIQLDNAVSVGRKVVDGAWTITKVDADTYTFTFGSNAVVAKTLGSNPLTVVLGETTVVVSEPAHNIADGTTVTFASASAVGGITPNGSFPITVIDANSYSYEFTSVATSSATGGGGSITATVPTTGGGSKIVITPQTALPAGAIDGTGSDGYGTGAYGGGPWGETPVTEDYFPRTWALDSWGEQLLASPRGGGLYLWQNNTAQRAAIVGQAPVEITHMLVAPMDGGYQAFALGCNQEVGGVFNPKCIRHCSVRDLTDWSTLTPGGTAREYILPCSGRIVAGRMCGPYMLVWTSDELFLGTFVGDINEPWRFDFVGHTCGLAGPNAAVVKGQTAFWVSPDRQFYSYPLGSQPTVIPCSIRTQFANNLAASQADKIVASSNSEFEEIRWEYPDARDGYENSRFIRVCLGETDAGAWSQGILARTAMVDAGPTLYPVACTYGGNIYYHEKGNSADGAAFSWSIKSAAQLIDIEWRLMIKSLWPDFQGQIGPVFITVSSLEHPQDTPTVVMSGALPPNLNRADLLVTGRLFQVEISGDSSPTWMRIGKPVIEVVRAGRSL